MAYLPKPESKLKLRKIPFICLGVKPWNPFQHLVNTRMVRSPINKKADPEQFSIFILSWIAKMYSKIKYHERYRMWRKIKYSGTSIIIIYFLFNQEHGSSTHRPQGFFFPLRFTFQRYNVSHVLCLTTTFNNECVVSTLFHIADCLQTVTTTDICKKDEKNITTMLLL